MSLYRTFGAILSAFLLLPVSGLAQETDSTAASQISTSSDDIKAAKMVRKEIKKDARIKKKKEKFEKTKAWRANRGERLREKGEALGGGAAQRQQAAAERKEAKKDKEKQQGAGQ